jgi:uncharacterized protein (DUF433 family)
MCCGIGRREACDIHLKLYPAPMKSSPLLERITFNPQQCGGHPCIRGMRIRVKDVLDMLAGGATEAEILRDFPYLEAEDIRASLEYASAQLNHPVVSVA